MKKNIGKIIIFFSYLSFVGIHAQTINEGKMSIGHTSSNQPIDVVTFFDFTNKSSATLINDGNFHIKKNYTNEDGGKIDHNNDGTTLFNGSEKQIINGGVQMGTSNGTTQFYKVVFNNSSSVDLAYDLLGQIEIDNQANFENGIVNNKTSNTLGSITFNDGATSVGASDNSYVNGKVKKIGNDAFSEFPIGSIASPTSALKKYRFAGISAPNDVNHLVTAEYFLKNSDVSYPHSQKAESIKLIDSNEYWQITGTENLILTLSWNDDTTPQEFLDNPDLIRIAWWNPAESKWINLGGIPEVSSKTVRGPISGEGIFTLAMVERMDDTEMIIYNALSPNDDGKNETFDVALKNGGIFKKLKVKIYNRWGILVYESNDKYFADNKTKFRGISEGRDTVDKKAMLPRGTYFYVIDYEYTDNRNGKHEGNKVGYLYIAYDPTFNGTLL